MSLILQGYRYYTGYHGFSGAQESSIFSKSNGVVCSCCNCNDIGPTLRITLYKFIITNGNYGTIAAETNGMGSGGYGDNTFPFLLPNRFPILHPKEWWRESVICVYYRSIFTEPDSIQAIGSNGDDILPALCITCTGFIISHSYNGTVFAKPNSVTSASCDGDNTAPIMSIALTIFVPTGGYHSAIFAESNSMG